MSPLEVEPVACLTDNYAYIIRDAESGENDMLRNVARMMSR